MSEAERDHWGRYKLPDPVTGETRPWTRATTLAEAMQDTYGLTGWKMRMVAVGIGLREDLQDLAAASDPEDKKQLDQLCKDAMSIAQADVRSNKGTSLHKYTQRLDQGQKIRAPRRWAADIAAYELAKKTWGIRTAPTMCERVTLIPELEVAGTMDRIVKYQDIPMIFDLKTGNDVERGAMKIAIQLALYSRGIGLWNEETEQFDPMPRGLDQEIGLVLHLPAGEATASLYEVNLKLGWRAAQLAYEVRKFRKDKEYMKKVGESVSVSD